MHSLVKGKISELAVAQDLLLKGFDVYAPLVDAHQIDFIVEQNNGIMKRVNVKSAWKLYGTAIKINLKKHSNEGRVDVIAIHYPPKDIIAYVPYENQNELVLALSTAKNNQDKKRKWFYSYDRFPEFS